jgi:hypothetical protein
MVKIATFAKAETLLVGAFDHFAENRPYINRTLCGDNFVVLRITVIFRFIQYLNLNLLEFCSINQNKTR